jgi:hypothetical protein
MRQIGTSDAAFVGKCSNANRYVAKQYSNGTLTMRSFALFPPCCFGRILIWSVGVANRVADRRHRSRTTRSARCVAPIDRRQTRPEQDADLTTADQQRFHCDGSAVGDDKGGDP